jgi:AcrR family transcriptional regulator
MDFAGPRILPREDGHSGPAPGFSTPEWNVFYHREMEERARRIVESAVELAERGGFEAVRLRDVAAHAGVALGTLYRRFRSKEDLLLAALEQEVAGLEQRMTRRPPKGETRLERVTSFFQAATRALCRRPNLARAMVRAVTTGDPELTQKMASFHSRVGDFVTLALRGEESPDGTLPATDEEKALARSLQMVWFAALVGWSGGLHGQPGIVEQTRVAAELMLRDRDD